eukprot:gene455-482_t
MGEEFWQRWQRDTYFQRLRSQQVTSDGFLLAQVLFRDFVATNTCLQEAKLKEEEEHLRRLHLQLQQQSASSQSFSAQDAWTMDCVGSGEEALERLKRGENDAAVLFDVIIVDENLGGAGGELMGHEVVRIVREEMKLTETVIIGCTSNTRKHTQNLLEAGADAVWPKPMPDERDILTQLAYFLSERKKTTSSRQSSVTNNKRPIAEVARATGPGGDHVTARL